MGRGRAKMGGPGLGRGSSKSINIINETDVWAVRGRPGNAPYVDSINESARTIENDFPGFMGTTINSVNSATLGGVDKVGTLGFYDTQKKTVALNDNYTNIDKMNDVYDKSVASGYHPGRGDKNGTEAVSYHELGHGLTSHIGDKMGISSFDDAAKTIVDNAYKSSGGKNGTKAWAGKISGYAQESYAECIAEAVSDWYCNGSRAANESKAIMTELKRYA